MSNTLSLTTSSLSLTLPKSLSLNLSRIFRSPVFKLTIETLTIVSLFTASTIWLMVLWL